MLYRLSISIIILIISHNSFSQIIDSKLSLHIYYNNEFNIGNETVSSGSFIIPSLYENYKNRYSLGGSAYYQILKNTYAGINLNLGEYSNWTYNDNLLFYDSKLKHADAIALIKKINPSPGLLITGLLSTILKQEPA